MPAAANAPDPIAGLADNGRICVDAIDPWYRPRSISTLMHVELPAPPCWRVTSDVGVPGLRSLYYRGPEVDRITDVYAYYGTPNGAPPAAGWPAVVLLHGGGGTAFAEWVRRWCQAGFAALAMDCEGRQPVTAEATANRPPTPRPGPMRGESDAELDAYADHPVGCALLAHSLLRSWPGIDADRIGICGISWGAVWTCVVAGMDPELAFAIPIYGCGHLDTNPGRVRTRAARPWDPAVHLPTARCPTLFVNGTTDECFPPRHWQRSVDACGGPTHQLLVPELAHGHEPAWLVPEPYEFAARAVAGRLPSTPVLGRRGSSVTVRADGAATAHWYASTGDDQVVSLPPPGWLQYAVTRRDDTFAAVVGPQTRAGFFLLHDVDGYRRSTPIIETT